MACYWGSEDFLQVRTSEAITASHQMTLMKLMHTFAGSWLVGLLQLPRV
jgi:hypothetical protein